MKELNNFGEEKMLDVLKDPFKKGSIISIRTNASQSLFNKTWTFSGIVEFKNGDTTGEQRFKGDSFDDVILKMKTFFESL